jgi:VCBS repeat-containing protein
MNKRHSHSSSIRIALETRMMFDGAAVVTADAAAHAPAAPAAEAQAPAAQAHASAPADVHTAAPSDTTHSDPTLNAAGAQAAVHSADAPPAADTSHGATDQDQHHNSPTDALHDALTATAPVDLAPARQEIFFVDSSLPDLNTLVASLPANADIVYLDNHSDGLTQIANALQGRENVDAIHIITHATEGSVVVGDSILNTASIEGQYHEILAEIGAHMSSTGDVLIYGCDFAAGTDGAATVMSLAQALNADVAASTNTTGVDGDWVLEDHVGTIETTSIQATDWHHDLLLTSADSATVYYGKGNVINVLANDALGGLLQSMTIGGNPTHGTIVLNADNTITYTPTAGSAYTGTDTFTYTVKLAGILLAETQTVTVFLDHPPTIVAPGLVNGTEDTGLTLSGSNAIVISDSDVSQTTTTVTLSVPAGSIALASAAGLTFSQGSASGSATLTFSGTITAVNTALNGLTYTPIADANSTSAAPINLTVTAVDPSGGTTVSNVGLVLAPVADIAADAVITKQSTPASFNVLANDNFENAGRIVSGYSTPAHGTVTIDAQGNAVYTPTAGYAGTDTFTYTVTSGGSSETATVTVTTLLNYAPTFSAPATQTFNEDTTRVFSSANGNAITVADANNDILTVTLASTKGVLTLAQTTGLTFTGGDGVADSSMIVSGTAAAINAALNGLQFIPVADYNGAANISLLASDGIAAVQSTNVALTLTPVADGVADSVSTSILTGVTFLPLANDTFAGTPNVTAISAPAHGIALLLGNSITYTPAIGFSGTDTFTYTVTSGGVTETIPITVTVGDTAPTGPASLGTLATVDKGVVLVLAGAQFHDADLLDILRYTATGLPAGLTIDPLLGTITGIVDGHASVNGVGGTGTYNVVVTATDLAGQSVSSSGTIVVSNPAPIPLLGLSIGGSQDALLGIGVQALAIIDPDGDAFSITNATAAHGTVTINNDGSLSYQPNANYYGADTITYTVKDVDGGQATGYVAVLLAQVPHLPVLSLPTIPLLLEDTPLIFANLLGQQITVGNIDGDVVTIDLNLPVGVGALSIANLSNHTGVSLTQTTDTLGTHLKINGLAADVNAALNDLIYTPAADYNGPLNITIGLGKLLGGIISVNATLPIGIAAVADIVDDNVTAILNTPTSFNVLANDTFENAGRVVSSYTTPLHGTVTIDAQGNAVYTPTSGYTGSDSFTYTVTSNGTVETATVHINAILPNYAPTISAPTTLTISEDTPQVFSSANGNAVVVADQNNDILTVTLSTNHGALTLLQTTGLTFTSGDGNADGTMTFSGSAAAINAALNGMSFIPTPDYNGSATISVQATDGIAAVQSSSIAVTINPVADGVADSISTGPLAPVTFFPLANDNFEGTPVITGLSQGAHGLVVLGLNGAVTYTPALGYLGADSFTYTVTSGGVSETITVNVAVGNHAPTANGNLGTLAVLDSQLAIAVPTAQAFTDVDTLDVLRYSATGLPAGLTINALTGLISGQVDGHASVNGINGTGTYNVVVTATDLAGASVTSNGTIVVTNPAPIPLVGLAVTGNEDVPIDISAAALAVIDPDGDTVTVTAATALHGTVAINANGSIRYTPNADYNGIDTITYQVRDADGATATGYVAVTVLPVIDLPTIRLPSVTLLAEDTPLVFANILGQHLEVGNVDGDILDLRLSVPAGLLSLTNSTGVSLSEGSTTGSTVLHFSGTTAAVNAALNSLVYTPAADYNGPLNITIGLGHLTAGILTVNTLLPITIAPVADIVDDHVSTTTGAAVSFNVLANDSFENAGRLVDSHTDPLHGSISIDAQGNVTYTPASGFTGTDSFQYTVLSNGTYETATVTIAINTAPNTNPVATPISNQSGTDSQPLNIDVHGYFSDADINDTLSYSATGLPSGININATTGIITGTLGSSASTAVPSGAYSVVVTASDGHGGLVSQSFVLVVANPAPTANADTASGAEDTVITGNVRSNDSDIDGDTLLVSTTPVQGPAHGTLVLNSDGSFSYTPNANFNGSDAFTYRLVDADGGTSTATVILTVTAVNDAPTTTGTIGTQTSTDSSNVSINVAGQFTDIDGDTLAYSALGLPSGLSIDSTGLISGLLSNAASHGGPNGDGIYNITVTASDGHGGTVSQTFQLSVGNPAPTTADSNQTTNEDTAFTATLAANDIDGDALTFSATTQPAHGTLVLNASSGVYTYTPTANFNGTDSFTYRVVDTDGGVATATVNIVVNAVNDAPNAVGSVAAQTGIDAAGFNLSVANRFSDVDGDTLSYSALNLPSGLSIDANGLISGTLATSASHGGVNGSGLYNVVVTASDGSGASTTQSFTLTVSNPVPVSANSAQTTTEDTPISATLTATDDDVVSFTPASGPSHGSLVLNGVTGAYTYTPAANFNGNDSFTYTVTDADGATTTATVSFLVTPVNDAPITNGTITAQTGNDGAPFNLNVAGVFTDVDNDSLSFGASGLPAGLSIDPATGLISGTLASSASQGGTGGVYSVTIIANDGHGATVAQVFTLTVSNPAPTASNSTLVIDEDTTATGNLLLNASDIDGDTLRLDTTPVTAPLHGLLVLNANGTYIYTPATDYNGSDSFSYRVIDADGAAVTATVVITVNSVNDVPVANGTLAAQSTNDSSAFSLNVSNAFRDVDSTLSYSVSGLPAGLTIDPATGLISGTVASSASQGGTGGVYSVVVSASDGLASVTQTFTLSVSNPAPTANTLTVTLAEDASATGNLLLNANDPDGDVLRLDTNPVTAPLHGSLTLNANGTYTYTPNANFNGSDSFSYRVLDADNASVIATVNFNVTPGYDAPVANGSLPGLSANDRGSVSVNVTGAFSDIDGSALSYSASGLPTGISIDPATGLISGTLGSSASTQGPGGHGVYTIVVSANDGLGGIATQTFTLTASNIAPTASNATVPVAEDSVATGTLLSNTSDADGDALAFVATSQPTHGTLVLNANGSYTYTPAANYNGSDSFNYRVTDADGGTTTATLSFNVTPVYDAPSAGAPIAALSANDSSAVSLNVAGNFNNVDNAVFTYSASGLPNGISINPTTGLISGTLGSSASTSSPDANGVYTIAVTVTDTTGATATQLFTLTAVNTLPVASNSTVNLLEDSAAVAGDLRASASDADGDALTFAVTSGPNHGSLTLNANGTYSYTPSANYNGADSFTYRVTDADGAVSTAVVTFNIAAVYDAPVAGTPISTQVANDSSAISLNVAGNFSDADNRALTYSASGLPAGLSINATTGLITGTLASSASTLSAGGNYNILVTASDGLGGTATQAFIFTAVNTLPVASNATIDLNEDSTFNGDLRTNTVDADGDTLTFVVSSGPSHGSLTFNANGTYTYTPAANYNGNDSFSYRVTDADGAVSNAVITFNVAAVYDAPLAGTPVSAQSANDGSVVSLNVAGNFSDADNRALSFNASGLPNGLSIDANTGLISGTLNSSASTQGIGGSANYSVIVTVNDGLGGTATQTFTFTAVNTLPVASNATVNLLEDTSVTGTLANNASDADGDVLSYAITSGPSHGSLQLNPVTGSYTYTPVGNYNGSDSFGYRVTDADGAVSTAVITLNVAPVYDAPQANGNLPALTANDSSTINLNVAGSFSDADNRALSYSAIGLPTGLSIDANTGLISGTLNSSASTQGIGGNYNVVVTASDTLGGSATQAFVLTAVNTLPTASGTSLTLAEDSVATGDLHALSADADNDTLTYSVAQAPANGTLVINANGTYSYTPNANFNGTDSFSYRVTDADNATTVATIGLTITPVYDAPNTNGPIAAQQANDSSTFNLAVGNRFADADGATLTYSATGLPAGVTIDPTSGLISGTLSSSASTQGTDGNGGAAGTGGNYSIVVTASDGVGGSISQTFVLTAVNPAPVASDAAISLGEQSSTSGNLNNYATDPDRDSLSFAIVSPVSNGSLVLDANGSFTYTPNNLFVGSDSVTYRVTDADGGTSTAVLVFNVVADNGGPVASGTISTLVANDHGTVNLNVAGAFSDTTVGAHLTYSASNLPSGLNIDPATGIIFGTLNSSASTLAPGGGGNYLVIITATDDFARSATQSFTLSAVNTVPIANNATLTIGEDGVATGNLNNYVSDADGDALTFSTVQQPTHGTLTINALTGVYTYVPNANFNGTDNFIYQVTDADGGFGRSTVITIVTPAYDGPLPNGTLATLTANDHSNVNLNIANAFSDADGTALTYSSNSLPAGLTLNPNTGLITGTLSSSASTLGSNGAGGAGGNYTVIITASDGLGGFATQSFTLVAVNTLPVAGNATVNLLEDTQVSGSLISTSSDVDGDTLTFAAITQPAHGSLSLNPATGAYTYTPAANFNGTDSFSYSVTDADGAVSNAMITFTVAPVYDAPVSIAPITAITANDHSSVSVNVSGNFSSPDNLPLTYSATGLPVGLAIDPATGLLSGTLNSSASTLAPSGIYTIVVSANDGQTTLSQTFTLTAVNTLPVASSASVDLNEDSTSTGDLRNNASDADQDTLSFAVTTGPTHGSLLFNPNGSYTYTPNANFNGSDSFSYRVTDADSGTSSIATITFNVAPVYDAPTPSGAIAAQTGNDGSGFNLNVAGTFSDVDNTPLIYSANGLPTGLTIDPSTGLISGTLGSSASTGGSNGAGGPGNSYTVVVSASDGLNTVTQTFVLTAFNIAPTANNATLVLLEDNVATGNLNSYASDTDGDALTFSASTEPTHGVLVLNANGSFSYTPVANFNGADSFNYTVTDADGASRTATLTFNVTAVHDAPSVTTPIASLTANDHGSVDVNVSGNFSSVDNLPLSYSATGLPAGLTLNPSTGLLSGTLSSSASALAPGGVYSIVVSASDGISSTSQTFVLTAVNTLPTATSSTVNLSEDTSASGDLRLTASDADQDVLSFAVANGPAHGSLTLNANGTYSYTPTANFNGSDSFTYTVTDADGAVTSATLTLNVAPAYDAPSAGAPIPTVTASDHSSVSLNVGGTFNNIDNATLTYSATGLPSGLSIDPSTGLISGTLSSSASAQGSNGTGGGANTGGNYSIVVSASDGINTATQAFTLTAINTLPVAATATLALPAGSNVSASLLNYAQDADGDVLSFTANSVPSHGTLVLNANGSFTYTPAPGYIGSDSLVYTVTDADGASTTATLTFTVAAGYQPPVANGSVTPLSAADHAQVNVNVAGNFSDANGNTLSYSAAGLPTGLSIDPTSGLITGTLGTSASTQGVGGSGTYNVVITASDSLGGSATQTFALTAINTLPSATGTTLNINEDSSASGDLRSVATDVDGDALSFATVTPPAHGTLVLNANGVYTYTPSANFNGTDSFTYQVTDADGASATATILINIAPVLDAPSANGSVTAQAANDGSSFSLDVAGNFNNPDNVPLTYTAAGLPAGLAIDANGLITGTLGSSASVLGSDGAGGPGGNYTVVVSVTDGTNTVTQSFVLTAINTVPTANNAAVPVPEDGSVTGSLTAITTDTDNDALIFSANSQPAHGVLVLNANGSYTYTPVANFNGVDSFNYTVTDADGASRTATLTFNVSPAYDAPSVTAQIATQTANDHGTVSLAVANNFTSVDNLPLTYSATGLPAGLTIDPATGLISGTLSSSASALGSNGSGGPGGNYSVTISASDGTSSVSQTFTLTAINTLPTATNASVTVQQGSDLIGNLGNYASDADGDALTFSAATQPANGVVSVGANGAYTYTPASGFIGQDSFTYRVTDADGGVTLATVTINVSTQPDQAPVVSNPVPTQTAIDGGTFNLNVANAFSDPEGDTLTYSVSGLPAGLTFNAQTGQISGTLLGNASSQAPGGVYTLTLTASDGTASVSQQVALVVSNPAPVTPGAAYTLPEDSSISGVLVASDPDGDSFVFAIAQGPANGSLTLNANGSFIYVPNPDFNGTDSFTYQVRDSDGGITNAVVTFTVTPVNDAPTATTPPPVTVVPGGPTVIDVLPNVSDADGNPLTVVGGAADHGTVVVNPNGTITYTPAAGYTGSDTITYTVSDGVGGSVTSTIALTVNAAAGNAGNGGTGTGTGTVSTTPDGFVGVTSTQRITDGLGGIPPSYTSQELNTYTRITHYDPVLLDAVNGVKRLGGLTQLSEDRPMQEVATGMAPLATTTEISSNAAPLSQATGDLQEQNRQQLDVDDMRPGAAGTVQEAPAQAQPATEPATAPAAAAPEAAPQQTPGSGDGNPQASNVTALPLTLNEQLQAASQARLTERDALARLLAS